MAQYARPSSDLATGGWSSAPLYAKIDEVTLDTADIITGPNKTDGTAQCGLSSVTDPIIHTGHILRINADMVGTYGTGINLYVELRQGATLIKSWNPTLTTSYATYTYTLLETEADDITNYADLNISFRQDYITGATGRCYVTWFEFEIPNAPIVKQLSNAAISATPKNATPKTDKITVLDSATLSATAQTIKKSVWLIFDHETGDDSMYNTGFSLGASVTAQAALAGTNYGVQVEDAGLQDAYADYYFSPVVTGTFQTRFYFDPNGITIQNGYEMSIFELDSYSLDYLFTITLYGGSPLTISPVVYDDTATGVNTTPVIVTEQQLCIETRLVRATTNISSNGYLQWWINGVEQTQISGIDNYDVFAIAESLFFGSMYCQGTVDGGTFYLDELVVNNTGTYIGTKVYNVAIPLDSAVISITPKTTTLLVDRTTSLDSGTITFTGNPLALETANNILLNNASISSIGQVVSLETLTTILVGVANLSATGQNASLSLVTDIPLSSASLSTSAQNIEIIEGAVQTALNSSSITIAPQNTEIIKGTRIIVLSSANVSVVGKVITLNTPVVIPFTNSSIVSSSQTITVMEGEHSALLNNSSLSVTGLQITVESLTGQITIQLANASLSASAQITTLEKGEVIIPLSVSDLSITPQETTVQEGEVITNLSQGNLSASGGAISVTSSQDNAMVFWVELQIPSTSKRLVHLDTAYLSITAQPITVTADVIVPLDTANLTISAQSLTITEGEAIVTLSMALLQVTPNPLTVLVDTIITLNVSSLSLIPQILEVVEGALTIQLQNGSLSVEAQSITIVEGEVIVPLSTASLSVVPQSLTVVEGEVTVPLNNGTITVTAQPISLTASTSIQLDNALITSGANQLSVLVSDTTILLTNALITVTGKEITLSTVTMVQLNSGTIDIYPLNLEVIKGETFILLNVAELTATATSLQVIEGAVTLQLNTALLTAVGQTLTVDQGIAPIYVSLTTALLTITGNALSVEGGESLVLLDVASITVTANNILPFDRFINLSTALLTITGNDLLPYNVIPLPITRLYVCTVEAENRVIEIEAENRTSSIEEEERKLEIEEAENRIIEIDAEDRICRA